MIKKQGPLTAGQRRSHTRIVGKKAFDRERLPSPSDYFSSVNLTLIGQGPWRSAACPFHADRRPSLRINIELGCFRCMSCGAHGGDVLDFERLRTGKGFVEAAHDLGAWEGAR